MMGVVQVHKSDSQFTFCTEKRKQELYNVLPTQYITINPT